MKIFIMIVVAVFLFIGLVYVWDWMQGEPDPVKRKPQRKAGERNARRENLDTGRGAPEPDARPKADSGMSPQERTLPYIQPEPKKPEAVKESLTVKREQAKGQRPRFTMKKKPVTIQYDWKRKDENGRDAGRGSR